MEIMLALFALAGPIDDRPGGGGYFATDGTADGDVCMPDDTNLGFGSTPAALDYWLVYNSTAGQLELHSTDCDGGGTDCVLQYWADGSSITYLNGDIDTYANDKQIVIPRGTINDPAIVIGDDDDGSSPPGIYSPAADRIVLRGNGNSALEVGAGGAMLNYSSTYLAVVAGAIRINNANVINLSGPLKIGGSATTSHSASTGSVIVGEDAGGISLEVDGISYFDDRIEIAGESKSTTLITTTLESDLSPGACTAGTWGVDTGGATRELCRCNDAGTAYDCISVTTANGPTD